MRIIDKIFKRKNNEAILEEKIAKLEKENEELREENNERINKLIEDRIQEQLEKMDLVATGHTSVEDKVNPIYPLPSVMGIPEHTIIDVDIPNRKEKATPDNSGKLEKSIPKEEDDLSSYWSKIISVNNKKVSNLKLDKNNNLYSGSRIAGLNPPALIYLKKMLPYYEENECNILNIKDDLKKKGYLKDKNNEVKYPLLKKYIYNLKVGSFDKVIAEYKQRTTKEKEDADDCDNFKKTIQEYHKNNDNDKVVSYFEEIVPPSNKRMSKLKLNEVNELRSGRGQSLINMPGLIYLKQNLPRYVDEKYTLKQIFDELDNSYFINKKQQYYNITFASYIYHLSRGEYDNLIKKYWENNNQEREINKSYRKKYKIKEITNNRFKLHTDYITKFTITDVLSIREMIDDYENYPTTNSIVEASGLSKQLTHKIIYNLQENIFDEWIKEYKEDNEPVLTEEEYYNKLIKPNQRVEFKNTYIDDEGYLRNSQFYSTITLDGVKHIKANLKKYAKENYTLTMIYQELVPDMIYHPSKTVYLYHPSLSRYIYNIRQGHFDDIIHKKHNIKFDNHLFESYENQLYIDGEETNLTIPKTNLILESYNHEENKKECLNKLIRNYPLIREEYIRLICEYSKNPTFMKLLRTNRDCKIIINNPEKRKEAGIY